MSLTSSLGWRHGRARGVDLRSGPDVPGGFQTFEYTPFDLPKLVKTGADANARATQFEYTADEMRAIRRDPDKTRRFVQGLFEHVVDPTGTTLEEHFRLYAAGRQVAEVI